MASHHNRNLSSSMPNSRNLPSYLSQSPTTDPIEHPSTASPLTTSRSAGASNSSALHTPSHRHAASASTDSIMDHFPMSANTAISAITSTTTPRKPRPRSGSSAAAFHSTPPQHAAPSSYSTPPPLPSTTSGPSSGSSSTANNKSKTFLSRFNLGGLRHTSGSVTSPSSTSSSGSSSFTTSPTSSQQFPSLSTYAHSQSSSPPSIALSTNPRDDATSPGGGASSAPQQPQQHRVKRKPVPQNLNLNIEPGLLPPATTAAPFHSPGLSATITTIPLGTTGRRASTISQNSLGSISTPNLFGTADPSPAGFEDSDSDVDDDDKPLGNRPSLRRVTSDGKNAAPRGPRQKTGGGVVGGGGNAGAGTASPREMGHEPRKGSVSSNHEGQEDRKVGALFAF